MNNEKKKEINEQQKQNSVQNKTVSPQDQTSPVNNQNGLINTQQNNSVVPGTSVQQIADKKMNSPAKAPNTVVNHVNTVNNQNKTSTSIGNNEQTQPVYQSQYDSQISGLVDKILNGEKFDYDVNSDALFANYADVYERNAKKAAEDAMGRSSAASGGYGNSFASAAASQAYNSQMQNLNAAVPQLQELAYQQYLAHKQDDYNQLNMIKGLDDSNYAKYRDSMSDYYADRDFNANREDAAWDKQFAQSQFDASRQDAAWDKQFATDQFEYGKQQDAQAQQNWQSEFDAGRNDAAWEKQFATDQFEYGKQQDAQAQQNWQTEFDAGREDSAWEKQFATDQFEYGKQQDAQAQQNWQSEFDAGREDSAWEKQFAADQFEYGKEQDAKEMAFNKMVWENDSKMQEAMAAAELGDYSLLELYTGADLSDAKKWDEIEKGAQLYSATGLVDYLKSAGVNTTQLEDNIANEKFANNLSMALSVYESTGSPKMLQGLGIDTSYMDKILGYTLMEAQKSANGSSGGSGGRSYSGGGPVVTSGSNDSYSEPAVWGDKTAADIAAEVAYYYQGQGVAWNSRTVSDYIVKNYPGLSIEAKHAINAYMADPDSGLEELMYTGMAPRK